MGKGQTLLPASQPSTDQPLLTLLRSCKVQWKDPYLDTQVSCVALGKSVTLAGLRFSHCKVEWLD